MKRASWLIVSLPLFAAGCGTEGGGTPALSKDDVRGGKGDHAVDWCDRLGWYGDGVCDDFCQNPDPDCGDACPAELNCGLYCPFGYREDDNGCMSCACKPNPLECQPLLCALFCEHGFDSDETGCPVCRCAEPPECAPVLCELYCPYGFDTDASGCEVCTCREPSCDELGGTCRSSPGDVGFAADCEAEFDETTVEGRCEAFNQTCCHGCSGAWTDENGGCRAPNDGAYPAECCAADRTPISGQCIRNAGNACTTDADCATGGCGGEVCFNPAEGNPISTCDCTAPALACGCVDGECSWYE